MKLKAEVTQVGEMSGPKGHFSSEQSAVVTTNVGLQEGHCEAPRLFDLLLVDQICLVYTKSIGFVLFFFSEKPV